MTNRLHIAFFLTIAFLVSCQQDIVSSSDINEESMETDNCIPGRAVVKVSESLAERLESEGGDVLMAGSAVQRTFSHGGRYEERMRKMGLHLWFNVEFDKSAPLTKAGEDLRNIEGVEHVEYMPALVMNDATPFFNDPELKKQWNLQNNGNPVTGLIAGCDVNVAPAWERGVVGNSNVIVAVLDGGVDYTHEDLKDNMWQGIDENGKPIVGYNFVLSNSNIAPDDHGSHVAGVIAAVNNNGIGISGIAGGDAAQGIKGVSIMSCEIVEGDTWANHADAFVWAANHGAVIAQNSWGFIPEANLNDTPAYIKQAIDYFNTYAGCDEVGNQLPDSPMKGGVVLFASGNEAVSMSYPASYEGCIAVSAIAGDNKLAYYSNFGDWIDITAPGGDASKNQEILSTVKNNDYARMQGTSMACPHVSGVAALIASEFGGPGFTREDLIDRLLKTAKDISLSPSYVGHGLVDASAAVAHYGEKLPHVPEFAKYEELSGTALTLKYIMPDYNEGVNSRTVELYWSDKSFVEVTESMDCLSVSTNGMNVGDTLVFNVAGLAENTEYHFSVQGRDALGFTSSLSENVTISTRANLPPVIEAVDGTDHVFKQHMWKKLTFRITDPENALADVIYEKATEAESFTGDKGVYSLVIDAIKAAPGTYSSRITAVDDRGETAECVVNFVIEENNTPSVSKEIEDIVMGSNTSSKKIKLSEYFTDIDGETLKYSATSSDPDLIKISLAKDDMTLAANGYGSSVITVTAVDAMGESVTETFNILVRDSSKAYDLYPNPVTDGMLYVRGAETEEVKITIVSSSGAVAYEGMTTTGPFQPAVENISVLLPGVYNVKVSGSSGKALTQNIVKL